MSYSINLYFDINEKLLNVDYESILELDNIKYIKDKIDNIKKLKNKYGIYIYFEDYDIIHDKEKNNIAKYKNIGIDIENNIIDFIQEIKQDYSIYLIINNNSDQIIYKYDRYKNINNTNIENIKTYLDQKIYNKLSN
jgi:hypothetical protein